MNQLKVEKMYFAYDDEEWVLDDVSFNIKQGDGCILLVGKNGAGKSTLINVLCGILRPEYGEVQRKGVKIGYLPFDSPLYHHLTIRENLRYFYRNFQGKNFDETNPTVKKVLDVLSIDYLNQRFDKCSSGQQQKAGIACILLSGADIIIMDEPFVAIDSKSTIGLIALIRKMKSDTVFLLTTHTISQLQEFADRLLLLDGKKLALDTSDYDVMQRYFQEDESV